jgi:beta-phosphoglucomutase
LIVPTASEVIDEWSRSPQPAVIFDFNGTLSDDEPILFDIFSELFRAHLNWDMTPEDYRNELLGRSDREIVTYAVMRHGRGTDEEIAELLRSRQGVYKERVTGKNPIADTTVGLVKLLADNDIPIGIVTGAQRDDVVAVLESCPAGELFSVLIAEEDVRNGKPHPEGFLAAARLLDRRPADVLVFEDSVPGVRAALAAGMHCIAVGTQPSHELIATASPIVDKLSSALVSDALANWRRGSGFPHRPAT